MSLVNFKPKNVEFVSYTGGWPNLCSGVLTLKIHGEEHRFGYRSGGAPAVLDFRRVLRLSEWV